MTPRQFARALLARLTLPETPNNVAALVAAQAVEGGWMHNAARYNPLNTTEILPGSRVVTPIGVRAYASIQDGVDATAKTFTNGRYVDILAALQSDSDPDDTLSRPGWKTWGWTSAIRPAATYQAYGDQTFPAGGPSAFAVAAGLAGAVGLAVFVARRKRP